MIIKLLYYILSSRFSVYNPNHAKVSVVFKFYNNRFVGIHVHVRVDLSKESLNENVESDAGFQQIFDIECELWEAISHSRLVRCHLQE